MLVVDDSKTNLLKMKEKLFELSKNGNVQLLDKDLEEYRNLVIDIDKEVYDSLITKIKNTNFYDLPFEEQLVILKDIQNEYDDVYEFECGYLNKYREYANKDLELSDLSVVNIEYINNRISALEGYLVNTKNGNEYKKEIENLNLKLIEEEKKKKAAKYKYKQLEDALRNNFINAEGRVYNSDGTLKYTSVISEYREAQFDLKELLNDKIALKNELDELKNQMNLSEEKLVAARICYKNLPNDENKKVYDSIVYETTKIEYKVVLLKILDLIQNEFDEYASMVSKRGQLLALNEERIDCLNKMNIRLSIDSFDRLKINEQIDVIASLGNNDDSIMAIRKEIADYDDLVEESNEHNNDLMNAINNHDNLIIDKTTLSDLKNDNIEEINEIEEPKEDLVLDNQVIKVSDLDANFMYDRVSEKVDGVISRVNQMFNGNEDDYEKSEDVTPDLVVIDKQEIDNKPEEIEQVVSNNNVDEILMPELDEYSNQVNEVDNQHDEDNKYIIDIPFSLGTELKEDIFENQKDNSVELMDDKPVEDIFVEEEKPVEFEDEAPTDVFVDIDNNVVDKTDDNLFQEVEPFTPTNLFEDRYDEGVFEQVSAADAFLNQLSDNTSGGNSNDAAFWPTNNDELPSIEKIDNKPKVLKKVV